MTVLRDGTVFPSFMGVKDTAHARPSAASTMSSGTLLMGEVVAAFYPGDTLNQSGEEVEYAVVAQERQANGTLVPGKPYRCTLGDGFGAEGDHLRASLRVSSGKRPGKALTDGALVLFSCTNADSAEGVIIKAIKPRRKGKKDPARRKDGKPTRFLDFEFNGVAAAIADDGSLTLTVPGPTDNAGQPVERAESNHGSKLSFANDGTITISDENGESIRISPGEKLVEVLAGAQHTTTEKEWVVEVGGDAKLDAEGRVRVHGRDDVTVGSDGNLRLGTDGARENLVLGKKLVAALQALVQTIIQQPMIGTVGPPGVPGPPVATSPALIAALNAWMLQWLQATSPAPILASDKFTER
jgi:hypothetical protein